MSNLSPEHSEGFYLCERSPKLPIYMGPFLTKEEATEALEKIGRSPWSSPEHLEIFMVSMKEGKADLVKDDGGCVLNAAKFAW